MKQHLLDGELPSFARKQELPIPHNAMAVEGASAYWHNAAKLYQIFSVHAGSIIITRKSQSQGINKAKQFNILLFTKHDSLTYLAFGVK